VRGKDASIKLPVTFTSIFVKKSIWRPVTQIPEYLAIYGLILIVNAILLIVFVALASSWLPKVWTFFHATDNATLLLCVAGWFRRRRLISIVLHACWNFLPQYMKYYVQQEISRKFVNSEHFHFLRESCYFEICRLWEIIGKVASSFNQSCMPVLAYLWSMDCTCSFSRKLAVISEWFEIVNLFLTEVLWMAK